MPRPATEQDLRPDPPPPTLKISFLKIHISDILKFPCGSSKRPLSKRGFRTRFLYAFLVSRPSDEPNSSRSP